MQKIFCVEYSVFFLLINSLLCQDISIKEKISINVKPGEGPLGVNEYYLNSPPVIYQGNNNEIILWKGAYLDVYDQKGVFLKRVGRLGEGPGEFHVVLKVILYEKKYYIVDFPNKVNVFNENFEFEKRFLLSGKNLSSYINDIDVKNKKIISLQKLLSGKDEEGSLVSLFDLDGKHLSSFFDERRYRNEEISVSLLGGRLSADENNIFYAYPPINHLWKMNYEGKVVGERNFCSNLWRKSQLSRKYFKDLLKKMTPQYAIEEMKRSGDRIFMISKYKNNIIVCVARPNDLHVENYFVLFDSDSNKELRTIFFPGYLFCGMGKDVLYCCKSMDNYYEKNEIEVLKCTLDR